LNILRDVRLRNINPSPGSPGREGFDLSALSSLRVSAGEIGTPAD
jgi:hypothetical protein